MEDDAKRCAVARMNGADTMAKDDTVVAARASYWAKANREDNGIAACQLRYRWSRLHPGALFRQNELATDKVLARLREKDRDLKRENMLAVKVLMQAIVTALLILQQQRCCQGLARRVAPFQVGRKGIGKAALKAKSFVPIVGDVRQARIKRRPQRNDGSRQRVREILVFASAIAVTGHLYPFTKSPHIGVIIGGNLAVFFGEQALQNGPSLVMKVIRDPRPVAVIDRSRKAIWDVLVHQHFTAQTFDLTLIAKTNSCTSYRAAKLAVMS
jgi:hypothetical protein